MYRGWTQTRLPKQALQYKPKGRRNIGRPRKRWRDQLHLEGQRTGNTPNPSGTWWWWWWWWWWWIVNFWKRFILCLPVFWPQIFSTFIVCFFFRMVGTPSLNWRVFLKTSNMESTASNPFQNVGHRGFGALFQPGCIFVLSYSFRGFLQDRQCTYHVTLREFVRPLLQWKSNKYYILWVCVCSLGYLAWIAYAPHYPLCPVQLYNIFPHYLIRATRFS